MITVAVREVEVEVDRKKCQEVLKVFGRRNWILVL